MCVLLKLLGLLAVLSLQIHAINSDEESIATMSHNQIVGHATADGQASLDTGTDTQQPSSSIASSSSSSSLSPSPVTVVADSPHCPLDVHAFFYLWYGNPSVDGKWLHWDHSILPHWRLDLRSSYPSGRFEPPGEAGSPYRPARGLYSSSDGAVLRDQFAELKRAGVCVVSVSWWGQAQLSHTFDGEGVGTDRAIPAVMDAAEAAGIKVNFHLEPYTGRNITALRADLEYITDRYSHSPAFYRDPVRGRPLFYVYDSYHIPASDWASLLSPAGGITVRGTHLDADFISLYLSSDESQQFILQSHFDGLYTYFASSRFTEGAQPTRWHAISTWAAQNGLFFIPCVGPGYDDTFIRPWNNINTVPRRDGAYYKQGWQAARNLRPAAPFVAISTYNEWGEGTQIEPASPYISPSGKQYLDYQPNPPDYYLQLTSQLVADYRAAKATS